MQEIKLDKHIKLLDSPGIVMSKDEDAASLALKNCIKVRIIMSWIRAKLNRNLIFQLKTKKDREYGRPVGAD